MSRQTISTIVFGGLLALIATRLMRPRTRMEMIRWAMSFWRGMRRNVFFSRLFSKAMARQLLRRFQLAR